MSFKFKPVATVSVIVRCQDKYLMVEERLPNGTPMFNVPSGHLEARESIIEGALRELDEETGLKSPVLHGLVGIYNFVQNNYSIIRSCFYLELDTFPELSPHDPDGDIVDVYWLTLAECEAIPKFQWRNEMVLDSIKSFAQGERYPLSAVKIYQRVYSENH